MLSRMIRIGPFDLDVPVGRGGMGEVWRATHRASLAPVAIKVLHRQLGRSERHLSRLNAEVRAMARLDHPGIAYVVDSGEVPAAADVASGGQLVAGSAWLALEYASGGPLAERCGKLDWPATRAILVELLQALAHAHARGVIHRDLKPGNVLLALPRDVRPGWKITDFGLARALGDPGHQTRHDIAGTPHYMAPEQIDREIGPHGPWTDLYALGCVGWALVAGRPPYADLRGADAAWAHLTRAIPRLEPIAPVPAGLEPWLRKLLARLPDQRFGFAADALAELRELPEREAVTPEDETMRGNPLEPGARARPVHYVPASWRTRVPAFPKALRGAGLGLVGIRVPRMVGRTAERDRLWEALVAVQNGSQVVVIRGPEGAGRSRLASWVARRAHEVGAATSAVVVPVPGDAPERALETVVERLVYAERSGEVPPWLEDGVGRLDLGDAERNETLVASLGRTRAIEPAQRRALIRALIERRVRTRPLVLIFEDVHLAPELVEIAVELHSDRHFAALPILWVLTARTDALADAPRTAERLAAMGGTAIDLGPLDLHSRASLVQEHGLAPAVAAQIDEVTAGNPKALSDRLADWSARGWLVPGATGFELAPGVAAWSGAQTAWAERVARLVDSMPLDAAIALEIAAVLGGRIDGLEWELTGAGGVEPTATEVRSLAADRLIGANMAEETPGGFVFAHTGVRDALADRARVAGRWAAHHERCAEMLLGRTGGVSAERLGQHLLEAGSPAQAVDWLLRGADARSRSGGPAAGLRLLALADTAMTHAGLPADDPRWGAFYLRFARAYLLLGELREVAVWAERARAAGQRHRWARVEAEALALLGESALCSLDLDRAERLLLEAGGAAAGAGAWSVAGEVRFGLSRVLAALGEESRSGKMAEQAEVAWSRAREPSASMESQRCAGWRWILAGRWPEARASLALARGLARERADAVSEAELLGLECTVHRRAGDLDTAETALRELAAWYTLLGHRDATRAWCELALVHLNRARWAAAYEVVAVDGARNPPVPGSAAAELRIALLAAAAATTGRWMEVGPALDQAEAGAANRRIGLPDAEWCLGLVRDRAGASGRWDLARRADTLAAEHRRKPMSLV
jgi:tetratricopeptide (TPR) repeat protein